MACVLLLWFVVERSTTDGEIASAPVEEGEARGESDQAVLARASADVREARELYPSSAGEASSLYIAAVSSGRERLSATVCIEDESGSRSLGSTTPEHLLQVDMAGVSFPLRLIATTEGRVRLAGQVVLGSRPPAGLVEIELDAACALAGVVVDHQGRPLPAGVRVVALDPIRRSTWSEDQSAGRVPVFDGRWAETVTDANGRFALSGLLPGSNYVLSAAGAGFVTNEAKDLGWRRYECGNQEITLTAYALFGGIARIGAQRTDELVRDASQVFFGVVPVLRWPKGSFAANPASELALAGTVIQEQARRAAADGRQVVAFTAPHEGAELGVTVQVRVPFLPPGPYEIELPRVEGLLPDVAVDVPEPKGALGSLEVTAFVTAGGVDRLDPTAKVGRLRLKRASETFEVTVRAEPLLTGFSVPGLPVGAYEWSLRCAGGGRLLPRRGDPAAPVTVTEAGGTLLLDLAWTGAAELRVRDHEGVLLQGPIQARFMEPTETTPLPDGGERVGYREVAGMSWRKPPYIAPFVPPGNFEVSCEADLGHRILIGNRVPIELRAGAVTSVELRAGQ